MTRYQVPAAPLSLKNAMVLAAGLGTRMRPLTDNCPKPLIQVAGKPLIDYVLDYLAMGGIDKAVVNVHYHAAMIEAHLATRQKPAITLSDERARLLETGGGLAKALPLLGTAPFICTNTDAILLDAPGYNGLANLPQLWQDDKMDALLLLCRPECALGYDARGGAEGDFCLDPVGRLSWPHHNPSKEPLPLFIYTGVQIIHPRLLKGALPEPHSAKLYWDKAMQEGRLYGTLHEGRWLHIGDPDGLEAAQKGLNAS